MPEDYGSKFTDEETKRLNEKIDKVYREAQADIQRKMDDFNRKYEAKDAAYRKMLDKGEITEDQYQSWQRGHVFQGKLWQAKRDQIENVISKANHASMDIINGGTPSVFAENMNFISFDMEKQAKADFGFVLADKDTVARLIKDDPDLLPKWKINEPKDYAWNKQKLGNCVTQGIIQGESLDKIGKRISDGLASSNKNHMMTFARTAMTGAQNAGRQTQMERAEKMGIKVEKQWMATLDSYTRDSHARLDGETVPLKEAFSNDCMYPGDPGGPPAEVYNCRCTMVSEVIDFPSSEYKRYENEDGIAIENMTYKEWKEIKSSTITEHVGPKEFKWKTDYHGKFGRDYGKADTTDALNEVLSGGHNSLENYLDSEGNLTPEREALHREIIDNYLAGKTPQEGTAIMTMMGGGPASGKSSAIKSGLYTLPDEKHSITVDPDNIKEYLPGYLQLSKVDSTAASFYHEESSMIAKQLSSTCFTENFNVTYDGTGDGSIGSVMKKINGAKDHGYKVNGMYVTIDTEEAVRRNQKRYEDAILKGGAPRKVPPDYVISCHAKVTKISASVSDKFDSISLYDNNGGFGETKLIATGGSGKALQAISGEEKAFDAFMKKADEGYVSGLLEKYK